MNIVFNTPEIKAGYEWQLFQDVNVFEGEHLVAKAELEIITLNKHRDAEKSYQALLELGATDWEIPLNLFFKNQNLTNELCEKLAVKPESKKSAQHIIIEAISVTPEHQGKGIAKALLRSIAEEYVKAQSLWVLSMPLSSFLDAEECEIETDKTFYQSLDLANNKETKEDVSKFFVHHGFEQLTIDEALLAEPLPFDLLVTSPNKLFDI